jgi:DNA adenine methylase
MARPFVKSPGGKRDHCVIEQLTELPSDEYHTYVEPFLGGGAAFWRLQEAGHLADKTVILGDADADLVSLYAAVRKNPHALHAEALDERDFIATLPSKSDRKKSYNGLRELWNLGEKKLGYQLVLRHACFNGVWRVNQGGAMNTPPRDKLDQLSIPQLPDLLECAQALESVELVDWDFREYEERCFIGPGTLVYLDPPYDGSFTGYTPQGFDFDDQADLVKLAAEWAGRGAAVYYTNAATAPIASLLAEHWPTATVEKVEAKRSVSADGSARGPAPEVIAYE